MDYFSNIHKEAETLVLHQVNNFFPSLNEKIIKDAIPKALNDMYLNFIDSSDKQFYCKASNEVFFNPYNSRAWMIFLYRLSHELGANEKYCGKDGVAPKEADAIYYLNKIMHSIDWYHQIELPVHFMCEHPLCSVLGRAKYGDYFMVYQGTTVGGNLTKNGNIAYPNIGSNVRMYTGSTILGDSIIGDNVVVSAGTYLLNEKIPDNCIVYGKTPNIVVKVKSEKEIKAMSLDVWRWEL